MVIMWKDVLECVEKTLECKIMRVYNRIVEDRNGVGYVIPLTKQIIINDSSAKNGIKYINIHVVIENGEARIRIGSGARHQVVKLF